MPDQLTLMAVCPHPDDECTSAGGVLARYAAEGVRTIVVTCTNGELGDAPGGIKPGEPGHDETLVVKTRLAELAESCRILEVANVETLGYRDSGMSAWDYKGHPDALCNVAVDEGASRLGALIEHYRPQVVIADDDQGGYDHPDHLRAHLIATKAVTDTAIPAKLYLPVFGRTTFEALRDALRGLGIADPEGFDDAGLALLDAAERRITTTVDVAAYVDQVRTALNAHASQIAESWFSQLPSTAFTAAFGTQRFIRAYDTTGAPLPETDLFAGLRG